MPMKVITQSEPTPEFTALRQQSRALRNIDTVVVGTGEFAFLEVVRALEAGAVVALLVDRPPPPTDIPVTLFGRPFVTSIAPAELARATGCALIPSYIVWRDSAQNYGAYLLPEVPYDRPSLRSPAARLELSQRIMQSFEPVIAEHLDQWFHFVPLWPRK